MDTTRLSVLENKEISATFARRFFDLQKRRRGASAVPLQKLVQPLMAHITRGELSQCDPPAFSRFLEEACQIARLAVLTDEDTRNDADGPGLSPGVMDCCIWLCSLSAAGSAHLATSLETAGTWIYANLVMAGAAALEDPQAFLDGLVAALVPLHLPEAEIVRRARTEFVMHASKRRGSSKQVSEATWARAKEWCGELVAASPVPDALKEAAKILQVPLPEEPQRGGEKNGKSPTFTPEIFASLRHIPAEELQVEWETCLIQVLGVPLDEVLGAQTARRVRELTPETAHDDAAGTMYFAAQDIWDKYWKSGENQALTAARQFAEFAYAVQTTHGGEGRHRANALQLVLRLQLPELLYTSPLEPIRAEAEPLFRAEGCFCSVPILLTGIVQAVAGACRAAERAHDTEDRDSLLTLHGEQLRQIHKDYEKLARERHTEETDAWIYLEPLIDEVFGKGDEGRPKVDPHLVRLVNRANHNDVLIYIATQLEQTRSALEQKLTRHRLSGDHLMRPSGRLINPQGQPKGILLPGFATGLRLLDAGEFERAAAEFEELATGRRLTGPQQNISHDYQAYALARWDRFIQAKPLLRSLCDGNYRFASAYWNLACIEAEREDQLRALVLGLQRAPHLNMLEAAVYLSVVLNRRDDEEVCGWLSLMPFLEALMLQYQHEAARLEEDEKGRRQRDDLLKRISAYIDHGDPVVPDPTNARIAQEAIIDLRDSLKQRDHLEVIGFWLRCHRPYETHFKDNRARTEYYKLRTDIWSDLGQPGEAAATFQEELEGHLSFLQYLLQRGNGSAPSGHAAPPIPGSLLQEIRSRLERQLRSCMAPDLEPVGKKLYRRVQEWETRSERKVVLLLDGPAQRKIHEFYGGGVETLERVLIRVSGEWRANLHATQDYPRQQAALADLLQALETAAKQQCAQALRGQMEQWDRFLQTPNPDDRKTVALEAQAAFNPLLAAFQQELSRDQLEMANGILQAIRRVNGRHLPGPKVFVTPVPDAAPAFRGDGQVSAFSLRVTTESGGAEARLTQAVARMQDTRHTFHLRDSLEALPVLLRPDCSALLTFEDDGVVRATGVCNLEVELTYEYLGQTLQTPALPVPVETATRAPVSIPSPYIYGGPLAPEEIEGRFFGRDEEQQTILELLTGRSSKLGYIEGIRRTGKTSLFNSIRHQLALHDGVVDDGGPRLIPVLLKGASVGAFSQVGQILHEFLSEICREPQVAAAGVVPPEEDACCANMVSAYRRFEDQLRERLPGHRVVAFWDDFQSIVALAHELAMQNQSFLVSTRALLEIIREQRSATSRLVWLFAGFRSWMRFITQLPGVNLWAELESIPIDFLGLDAVRDILVMPLLGTPMAVMAEAVARVYEYTQGYPEVVQRMAASMLARAQRENRYAITPADADAAAREVGETPGLFADTWCPVGEISETQRKLIGSFINVVQQLGGRIAPHRLVGTGSFTEDVRKDVDDLVARKILTRHDNGTTVGVKAPVLEMWMRNHWKNEEPPLTAAVFIDLANLTRGTGDDVLELAGLPFGDIVPGTFRLKTVLDAIDRYAADLVPTPVTEKWAINYPPGSRAVPILDLNKYHVEHIDQKLFEKGKIQPGSDDTTLQSKIAVVTSDRPAITHVVVVTGDKDFKIVGVNLQLDRGKSVHILTLRASAANDLIRLAHQYPQKCKLVYLEELLASHYQDRQA